jgi:hypothetical protein
MQPKPVCRLKRVTVALAVVLSTVPMAAISAQAAELHCTSLEEAEAFRLRHLQSRLMVAALGCNQQAAYNTFVEHFKPTLAGAGFKITDYFKRIGGGQTALNRHITELANAAGLSRAEDPAGFCKQTWELFWSLEQDPRTLSKIAETNLLATPQPKSCSVTVAAGADTLPQNVTATFDATKAAADKLKK